MLPKEKSEVEFLEIKLSFVIGIRILCCISLFFPFFIVVSNSAKYLFFLLFYMNKATRIQFKNFLNIFRKQYFLLGGIGEQLFTITI